MPSYLSLLFGLKWKLMLRGYQRNKMALVGAIIVVVAFTPMALGAAIGTGIGYRLLPVPFNEYLLRAVLSGIYGFWLLLPMLGFALNESYDITRLILYPISPRQIFIGSLLGSFLDFSVLLTLPMFLAALLGLVNSVPGAIFLLIALSIFLIHTLALSQAIVLASLGALRSRRWRDILTVIGPLLGMGIYLLSQVAPRYVDKVNWRRLLDNPLWNLANFSPPGFTARVAGAAGEGNWANALVFLLPLAAAAAATIYLAGHLVQIVSVGEGISSPARRRPAVNAESSARSARAAPVSLLDRWLPPVVAAVAGKEWKYLFRDPFFKMSMLQSLYTFAIIIVVFVLPRHGKPGMEFGTATMWVATGWLLLGGMTFTFNIFGTDGAAAGALFLFPGSRRQIILGKNLVAFLAEAIVNLALLAALHVLLRSFTFFWQQSVLLLLGIMILISAGNIMSVLFPMRMVMRGWRMQQQSAGKGCGRGLMTMLGMSCCMLLMLPVVAAVVVPTFLLSPLWFALTLPLATVFVLTIYWYSLQISPPMLMQRETDIMATMLAEE